MNGTCMDCGKKTLVCLTCASCIKCHAKQYHTQFCVLNRKNQHCHYIISRGDLVFVEVDKTNHG